MGTHSRNASWVAARLYVLAQEHGAPNRFHLHELDGNMSGGELLAVCRIARLESWRVNECLAPHALSMHYALRSNHQPAHIVVEEVGAPGRAP